MSIEYKSKPSHRRLITIITVVILLSIVAVPALAITYGVPMAMPIHL